MKHHKIAIIGVGAVGSTIAYALMLKNLIAEVILMDVDLQRCKGEVYDLSDVLGFSSSSVVSQGTYDEVRSADIIIIAAGKPQKPGQSRVELVEGNLKILSSILKQLHSLNSEAQIIVVANPLDILTLFAQKEELLPRRQVFGTGTYLDSQRMRYLVGQAAGVAVESVNGFVLGEHGDSQFIAWSTVSIGGVPIEQFAIDKKSIEQIAKNAAYRIIETKGATYYGIATCVARICEIILFDTKEVVPLSWYHEEYEVCLSLPVILGERGIERVIKPALTKKEQEALEKSASFLKSVIPS